MSTVHILGGGGMLGQALIRACMAGHVNHTACPHRVVDISNPVQVAGLVSQDMVPGDVVINAAGAIPLKSAPPIEMLATNAIGPWVVAEATRQVGGIAVVHVSTDCVFAGKKPRKGGYQAGSLTSPMDLYGRSKLAGEVPMSHVINVRTSFVGPEHGLWKHILESPGRVNGWRDTSWSGSTVDAVAASLLLIATNTKLLGSNRSDRTFGPDPLRRRGNIEHLATARPLSKLEVCELLCKHLGGPPPTPGVHGAGVYRAMEPTIVLPSLADALAGLNSLGVVR